MLKKEKVISQVQIMDNHIHVRYSNRILENDKIIAETYERDSFAPDCDIESLPEQIKPYAAIVFTEEVKNKYKNKF